MSTSQGPELFDDDPMTTGRSLEKLSQEANRPTAPLNFPNQEPSAITHVEVRANPPWFAERADPSLARATDEYSLDFLDAAATVAAAIIHSQTSSKPAQALKDVLVKTIDGCDVSRCHHLCRSFPRSAT
jgi:hypothetical protein